MSVYPPGWEQQHGAVDTAAQPPEQGLFARIERLVGQESALLAIPDHKRDDHQRERLRSIGAELDRVFERLRERARELAGPQESAT
jgi:hypothetical protein